MDETKNFKGLDGKVLNVQFKSPEQHSKERTEEKRRRFERIFGEYEKDPESHPEVTRAINQYKWMSKQPADAYGGVCPRECPICEDEHVRAYDFCPDCIKFYRQYKSNVHKIGRFIRGLF